VITLQTAGTAADDSDSWHRVRDDWLIYSHAAHQPIKFGDFLVH
jgi:hypothetical protein